MPGPVLEVQQLTKRYGAFTAVDALSLQVQAGEIFGFLGPNGAGKTTSINMICGLLKPDSGMILLDGVRVSGDDPRLRVRVGVCPQASLFWPKLTCLEQLAFLGQMYGIPGRQAAARGRSLLAALGLEEKRDQLAGTLSGGMQRRLNLALGLIHEPQILILDEPEAGLDPQSRVLVREFIRAWSRESGPRGAVILTTHNMDEADRLADRVAIIDHGALLVLDTPEALKRSLGGGDVLEITLEGNGHLQIECALDAAIAVAPQAQVSGSSLLIRAEGVLDLLAPLQQALARAGFARCGFHLRENSLEDVFISLTGRRLRE
jgi:ABC-2 type transport system ATP-binding protein